MTTEEITEEIKKQVIYVLDWAPTRIPLTNKGCEEFRQLYLKCLDDSLGPKFQEIKVEVQLDHGFKSCTVTVSGSRSILEELCTPPLTVIGKLDGVNIKVNIDGE
jgi:hypothetical protein